MSVASDVSALAGLGCEARSVRLADVFSGAFLDGRFTGTRDAALAQQFAGAIGGHRFTEMETLCLRHGIG